MPTRPEDMSGFERWLARLDLRWVVGSAIIALAFYCHLFVGGPWEVVEIAIWILVASPFFIPKRWLWISLAALAAWIATYQLTTGPWMGDPLTTLIIVFAAACLGAAAWVAKRRYR